MLLIRLSSGVVFRFNSPSTTWCFWNYSVRVQDFEETLLRVWTLYKLKRERGVTRRDHLWENLHLWWTHGNDRFVASSIWYNENLRFCNGSVNIQIRKERFRILRTHMRWLLGFLLKLRLEVGRIGDTRHHYSACERNNGQILPRNSEWGSWRDRGRDRGPFRSSLRPHTSKVPCHRNSPETGLLVVPGRACCLCSLQLNRSLAKELLRCYRLKESSHVCDPAVSATSLAPQTLSSLFSGGTQSARCLGDCLLDQANWRSEKSLLYLLVHAVCNLLIGARFV